jgi:hypothetical protein
MSNSQRRRFRCFRVLCATCRERKARFRYRGEVRADRDRTLCFKCYRRELDRLRARRLAQQRSSLASRSLFESRPLDERQLSHRRRMLMHLQTSSVRLQEDDEGSHRSARLSWPERSRRQPRSGVQSQCPAFLARLARSAKASAQQITEKT